MLTELEGIPFDHFQRYAAAASLVSALQMNVGRILEVGANRQRLLADFLPQSTFVFSDLFDQPNADNFVRADASALPFTDQQFDVSVSLDVLEHMPVHLRAKAVSEMARVSERMVVIACPPDQPWVHEAEASANGVWRHYFCESYPWLDEHKEFGLVSGDEIERALLASNFRVLRFGQGDTDVWSGLMTAHFVKEVIAEMKPLVAAADRLYNHNVFAGDRGERSYREFFIGVRHDRDVESVQLSSVMSLPPDTGASAFLSSMGGLLQPIANRILSAEKEWKSSVELLRISEGTRVDEQKSSAELLRIYEEKRAEEQKFAAELLRISEEKRAEEQKSSAELLRISEEKRAEEQKFLAELLRVSEEKQAKVVDEWGKTAELFRQSETMLFSVRADHESLLERFQVLSTESEDNVIALHRALASNEEFRGSLDQRSVELAAISAEKLQTQKLLSELESRHQVILQNMNILVERVHQLERRQRLVAVFLGIIFAAALVACYFRSR
jgi:ubiquinone/menaquinone biosynthesis C-methylase UbiE